ncbi:hypothetical protein SprV_0200957700 [Sparganum proliferum]
MDVDDFCAKCRKRPTNPHTMVCGHTFCLSPCVQAMKTYQNFVQCPLCRIETDVAFLKPRRSVHSSHPENPPVCSECNRSSPTSKICDHCSRAICPVCTSLHQAEMFALLAKKLPALKSKRTALTSLKATLLKLKDNQKSCKETLTREVTSTTDNLLSMADCALEKAKLLVISTSDEEQTLLQKLGKDIMHLALAVETLSDLLRQNYDGGDGQPTAQDLIELMGHCLQTFFTFEGTTHEQIKGTPMGSPISGLIAEAVLQKLERRLFEEYKPKFWARYVHDTFVIIDQDKINYYAEELNSIIPDLQFTMEEEVGDKLPFLDVLVCRQPNGELATSIYRKPTNTLQMLSYNSNHPLQHKRSCVRTLYRRVETHCSTPAAKLDEIKLLRELFRANGYPQNSAGLKEFELSARTHLDEVKELQKSLKSCTASGISSLTVAKKFETIHLQLQEFRLVTSDSVDLPAPQQSKAKKKSSTNPAFMRKTEWDVNPHRIFVGSLPESLKECRLHEYFSEYGIVTDVFLSKGQESRRFGFVAFRDLDSVRKVLDSQPHKMNETLITVSLAKNKRPADSGVSECEKGENASSASEDNKLNNDDATELVSNQLTIFVGQLKPGDSEADLKTYFSKFGTVTEANATITFAAYEYIQEGQLVVLFLLYRKLNVREDGVEMFVECQQLIPVDNDEGIINIPGSELRDTALTGSILKPVAGNITSSSATVTTPKQVPLQREFEGVPHGGQRAISNATPSTSYATSSAARTSLSARYVDLLHDTCHISFPPLLFVLRLGVRFRHRPTQTLSDSQRPENLHPSNEKEMAAAIRISSAHLCAEEQCW